uniref:non-specific serine/threonine protein kinase n=1 Tax=Anthurium amnicola TaxID=1678845 RepID=A0A1D1YK16_9ARAE
MVSSQISSLTQANAPKPFNQQLLHPLQIPHVASADLVEFDFSDVFGPSPIQHSIEVHAVNSTPNDPEVIHNRSHSLVGPSPSVNQPLQLSKLTIHEAENCLDLVDCVSSESEAEAESEKQANVETADSACKEAAKPEKVEGVGLEDFEVLKVVGQGAFGKVFQVRKKGTSEIYAMKVMRKDKIMEKNHAEYMKAERDILTKIDHPFIVQLRYSFQTKYRLYLVLDFINGGHLFFQLYRHIMFSEDLARIYTAEIVSAVSHLHANGIMHRDLKPENILLDADGHVMLTDFGVAKQFEEKSRSNSLCGTIEYMAPEIVLGKGHDKAADWWSVGILLFEMLTAKPPYCGGNREKIQKKIIKEKIRLPPFLSSEVHSLLKGLLQKDPSKRLGNGPGGINEIKNHKWFRCINWRKLEAREIQPGFRPDVEGKQCVANFDECWTNMPLNDSPVASPVAGDCNFKGFSYVRPANLFKKTGSIC